MKALALFLLLAVGASAGWFHPDGYVALRGSPANYPAPWVWANKAEALAVWAVPFQHRKWTGSTLVEMSQAEKDAVDATIGENRAGKLVVTWNATRITLNQLLNLFPSPTPKQQAIIDVVTAYKAELKADLAALGLNVPD